jgi:hypothetical protein
VLLVVFKFAKCFKEMIQFLCLFLILSSKTSCLAGSISNTNFVFETFSPRNLIRFFEFNDFGFNISSNCIKDLYIYLDALQKDLLWAYKRKLLSFRRLNEEKPQ